MVPAGAPSLAAQAAAVCRSVPPAGTVTSRVKTVWRYWGRWGGRESSEEGGLFWPGAGMRSSAIRGCMLHAMQSRRGCVTSLRLCCSKVQTQQQRQSNDMLGGQARTREVTNVNWPEGTGQDSTSTKPHASLLGSRMLRS